MSLRINPPNISAIQGRALFFDANVLLYLFGSVTTPSNQWAVTAYSAIFKQCLNMNNKLCLDVFVLSEFVNRILRSEYENHLKTNGLSGSQLKYKQFRIKNEGLQAAQDVEMLVKNRILKRFSVVGKLFNTADINAINFVNTDFNDELIIKTCQEHQCVLVTNDADFSGANVDILTANAKLK